ncbi:aminotransferase class III-fold pyridoxal phosphate-dependent enzyme [Microbacterium sp. RD1]|uniref:aminotransferase class III-fold pyridoxal phosphate-dependent enzyme n=1 Tax=Microbacterium sp. RD1 TaxID=3457313 RepID=UPI003FA56B9A
MSHPKNTVLEAAAPLLAPERAVDYVAERWGISARTARALSSERDAIVMLDDRYVLKVSNPAEQRSIVDMENAVANHLAAVAPELPVPRTVPTRGQELVDTVVDDNGRACLTRVVTMLPGSPLEGRPVTADVAEQMGETAARTTMALAGLFHPASGRVLDWDVRRAPDVVRGGAHGGGVDKALLALVPRFAVASSETRRLPSGIQHGDITLTNVLSADGRVTGLIDFGDTHHTAAVCDLAVTLTSVVRNTAPDQPLSTWELIEAVLDGYQRHRTLSPAEVAVLGELVLARLALTVAIAARRQVTHADNAAYITQHSVPATRVLTDLAQTEQAELAERLARLCGTVPRSRLAPTPDLPQRRAAVMGGRLSPVFYAEPLEIVRGKGSWLFDAGGRRYLDGYNNVAVLGHAHPAVANAVGAQLRTLNTHSRYLHPSVVDLAERLIATMPAEIDTCLFTTSGTEANDLAWRLATAHTGGTGAVVAEHAYHGSSKWLADLSPNEWPTGYRPTHVATFAAPRPYPGGLGRETAAARIDRATATLAASGDRLALVLADTAFTSEGIWDVPDDFLAGLVDGAHRHGGLYLADEVQSGFHRTGEHLWRFAAAGVVPDLVTLGKPMGAGYPIGAVLTRRDIADSLASEYEYFSTFAATPAAAAAGLAVLDRIQITDVAGRVTDVGEHLRQSLAAIASPRLGDVRGRGLIVGVDLVPPPGAHPRRFAADVLNGLVRRGVIAGLTGPGGDVLKVRPPLSWRREHAELFVNALRETVNQT